MTAHLPPDSIVHGAAEATEQRSRRGALVSVEGLNGVGKSYLTDLALAAIPQPRRPLTVTESSRRDQGAEPAPGAALGRQLLRALVTAAAGEPFLRAGLPRSETMLLLAIKTHDFETSRDALVSGRTVVEGRSLHSVAVYQSLILEPEDDERAADRARSILATATAWRPLPDLTILLTDDPATAVARAEVRDDIRYSPAQWRIHHRAAALFGRLAHDDPAHVRTLDRRGHDSAVLADSIRSWIESAPRRAWTGIAG